ncbi:MAG: hypoxanthine-guanine phosphoribosyltransferase [Thiohalocapsa sp.]|jgi:hypoxanthine phosphoribosyltransferase|uniref:hypoxanthine-guanine phosphoribosyltransferase n=1 Tax=Thiohalocapsa sp. TaxID=2497641 RepID=UPI0026000030|nr:hypoxanthine-guanine phosphoribosyltransferase [Thiohalocapsa sp.]MCG6940057.1 hypoxanthine-guanine phosphoribosyltransferase [Thiohalocapsa sp.]
MDKMPADHYAAVLSRAECLADRAAVDAALDGMAAGIRARLGDKDPLVLSVVTGGIVVTGLLLPRLDFPLRLDYVHATRYRGALSGADLHWQHRPAEAMRGEHVLVVDDIFDQGHTMEAIVAACREDGAASVTAAVLALKEGAAQTDYRPDVVGLTIPDRYVMGYGLDYKRYFRNLRGIYAAADEDT